MAQHSEPSDLDAAAEHDLTATFVYQINQHWAAIIPVRGIWSAAIAGWNLVPEVGIVWKP